MNQQEKQILENIAKALPEMTDYQKNYLLGLGEGMVLMKEKQKNAS